MAVRGEPPAGAAAGAPAFGVGVLGRAPSRAVEAHLVGLQFVALAPAAEAVATRLVVGLSGAAALALPSRQGSAPDRWDRS